MMLAAQPAHASTTFYVNSTGDKNDLDFPGGVFDGSLDGKCFTGDVLVVQGEECTLQAAIQQANKTPGADTIEFDIPGTGVTTIAPASQLPTITGPVAINGYSQPGSHPNTKAVGSDAILKVEFGGANEASGTGLSIAAPNTIVKGLAINRRTYGIRIDGADATGNRIAGNYIGTDATGTQDLGNGYSGVFIYDASGNVIGGAEAAGRNVISGNEQYGVPMNGQATVDNRIVGNYIGTDATGTTDLGNQYFGVIAFQASKNNVGGTTAAAHNVVSGNAGSGVSIVGNDATGNRVLGNSMFSNGGLGIDLYDDGPTANDSGDADTGANNPQNKPTLSSAKKRATGTTTVRGTLNSTPDKTFNIQFFSNPKGTDEGKTLLGTQSITTDGSANVSFTFSTTKPIGLGQNITATATGPGGNTSEFSVPKQVVAS